MKRPLQRDRAIPGLTRTDDVTLWARPRRPPAGHSECASLFQHTYIPTVTFHHNNSSTTTIARSNQYINTQWTSRHSPTGRRPWKMSTSASESMRPLCPLSLVISTRSSHPAVACGMTWLTKLEQNREGQSRKVVGLPGCRSRKPAGEWWRRGRRRRAAGKGFQPRHSTSFLSLLLPQIASAF